jgi:hypothetical protein
MTDREMLEQVRDILRANWSSHEFLMSYPPKHIVCYRAWEMLDGHLKRSSPERTTSESSGG